MERKSEVSLKTLPIRLGSVWVPSNWFVRVNLKGDALRAPKNITKAHRKRRYDRRDGALLGPHLKTYGVSIYTNGTGKHCQNVDLMGTLAPRDQGSNELNHCTDVITKPGMAPWSQKSVTLVTLIKRSNSHLRKRRNSFRLACIKW
jgi:hypothetical protein